MTLSRRLLRMLASLLLLSFLAYSSPAQNKIVLADARQNAIGQACDQIMDKWPKEVLCGIVINKQGDVFFTMTGGPWFDQLFTGAQDGIVVDLVTKDQYDCTRAGTPSRELPRGLYLPPLYLAGLKQNMLEKNAADIYIRIGSVPDRFKTRITELEGNLGFLKNGQICHYKHFTDLDRSLWQVLPMGLYTDTLIAEGKLTQTQKLSAEACDRKVAITIQFPKGKANIPASAFRHLADSLLPSIYYVKKIDLQVNNSVEGSEEFNDQLGDKRLDAVQELIKKQVQPYPDKNSSWVKQNWNSFYEDIEGTPFASWVYMSDTLLARNLQNKSLTKQLEPMFKKHRNAIITFYLDKKSRMDRLTGDSLSARFKQALLQRSFFKATLIQEEVIARIADASLPADYLDSLEIPQEKMYSSLLSDRETYKVMYGLTYEFEALENFKTLLQLDSSSSRIRYNICALTFSFWEHDTSFVEPASFWKDIQALYHFQVDSALVTRMQVNFHIINSEHNMLRTDYAAKDRSVDYITGNYVTRNLSDDDLLSLAKYLCHYSQRPRAVKLVQERLQRGPLKEDLLFYYLNMQLFELYREDFVTVLKPQIDQAIRLNRFRYCKFFNSLNNGGASFQLLGEPSIKALYCEQCNGKAVQ